jgi:thiosulfate oxidation carrier complex protein SoxZ
MTTLFIARHGQTDWNFEHRWQGHADPPLNATGRAQAAELGEALAGSAIEAVFSSDLRRAAETAEIVAARLGLLVELDARLREVDVGEWSGLTAAEVEERYPEGFLRRRGGQTGWTEGEELGAMAERVVAALLEIAGRHPDGRLLVVTHGGPMRATLGSGYTDVRVLMTHPMTTAQSNQPLHFIQNITVKQNGKAVVEAQISQAISRNPVFTFRIKGGAKGDKIEVSWLDNKGETSSIEAAVA